MLLDQIIQAAILGILQGLTEFLPISSSAHLILLPWLFNWEHLGLSFDVLIHGGTLLAILIYFHKDWRAILLTGLKRIRGVATPQDGALDLAVVVGTIPAVIVALMFRPFVEACGRTPEVTVITLSAFGLILGWADRYGKRDRRIADLGLGRGFLIGLAQAIALIPGVSRSGVTITAGLLLGFSRTDSARFSFLLSGPIIALATLNGIYELSGTGEAVASLKLWAFFVGVITSLITGLLCIKYFLRFLQTKTLSPFVIYRLGLAGLILILMLISS